MVDSSFSEREVTNNGRGVEEEEGGNGRNGGGSKTVPLTVKVADRLTEPARFDAEQAYSPACLADTPSMLSVLRCLLILVTVILESLDVSIATPLNAHDISMGMSPFKIEQGTDTESPELATSALNAIGRSCGPTEVILRLVDLSLLRDYLFTFRGYEKGRGKEGRGFFRYGAVLLPGIVQKTKDERVYTWYMYIHVYV